MLFKKKAKQQEENDISASLANRPPSCTDTSSESKEATMAGNPTANVDKQPDIVYPSGFKLLFLMMSIFIGMFLVSLVRRSTRFSLLLL